MGVLMGIRRDIDEGIFVVLQLALAVGLHHRGSVFVTEGREVAYGALAICFLIGGIIITAALSLSTFSSR